MSDWTCEDHTGEQPATVPKHSHPNWFLQIIFLLLFIALLAICIGKGLCHLALDIYEWQKTTFNDSERIEKLTTRVDCLERGWHPWEYTGYQPARYKSDYIIEHCWTFRCSYCGKEINTAKPDKWQRAAFKEATGVAFPVPVEDECPDSMIIIPDDPIIIPDPNIIFTPTKSDPKEHV